MKVEKIDDFVGFKREIFLIKVGCVPFVFNIVSYDVILKEVESFQINLLKQDSFAKDVLMGDARGLLFLKDVKREDLYRYFATVCMQDDEYLKKNGIDEIQYIDYKEDSFVFLT